MDCEVWVPAAGYEGRYEVSSFGRIKSLSRIATCKNGRTRTVSGKILSPSVHPKTGRLSLCLEGKMWFVHRIVAVSFLGPCPDGMHVCHWDDNPKNNCVTNLRYATCSENMFDRVRNGIHHNSSKSHCKNGHEFTEGNTKIVPVKGGKTTRVCIECYRRRAREWARRKKVNSDFGSAI